MQMTAAATPASNLLSTDVGYPGRLGRLSSLFAPYPTGLPLKRHGGVVTEVSATHILVGGLERRAELGCCVEIENGQNRWLGEIIGVK